MAQCYRNSGSLKNGMAAQAHRTSGSFAPRLFNGELVKHLNEVDDTAKQRMELLTLPMHKRQGVNDALKVRDQMA